MRTVNKSGESLLKDLETNITEYYSQITEDSMGDLWERSYNQFAKGYSHNKINQSHWLRKLAKKEIKLFSNDYASILKHLHVLVTKDAPTLKATARNVNYETITETISANKILEYTEKTNSLSKIVSEAKLYELIFGEGYIVAEWGKKETFSKKMEYDLIVKAKSPFDIIRNTKLRDPQWYIVRNWEDYETLKEEFPDKIIESSPAVLSNQYENVIYNYTGGTLRKNNKIIDIYTYYHLPTKEKPNGRRIKFCKGVILEDEDDLKGARVIPAIDTYILNTNYGLTVAMDLLPLQTGKDALLSATINNSANYGAHLLVVKKTGEMAFRSLAGGASSLVVDDLEDAPRTVNLLQPNAELMNQINMLVKQMETISGINPVIRGEAKASQSGQALALITSMALQSASGYVRTYREVWKTLGETILSILQQNLTETRTIEITGESQETITGELNGRNMYSDYNVFVELQGPLTNTVQGRSAIFSEMYNQNKITNTEFLTALKTGNFDNITKKAINEENSFNKEKYCIIHDKPVYIKLLQDHQKYIIKAQEILDDTKYLDNIEVENRVNDYIAKRTEIWQEASNTVPIQLKILNFPLINDILGIPPEQPPEQPQPPLPQNEPTPTEIGNVPLPNNPLTNQPPEIAIENNIEGA